MTSEIIPSIYHRIVLKWNDCLAVDIEWTGGKTGGATDVPPFNNVVMAYSELKLDALGLRGIPPICWRDTKNVLFEPLQLREATSYLLDVTLPVPFEVALVEAEKSSSWPFPPTVSSYYRRDPSRRWVEVVGGVRIGGTLNFDSYIGVVDLGLTQYGTGPIRMEVACSKFGYFDDLKALLDAISDEAVGLLLEVDAPTFVPLDWDEIRNSNPLTQLLNLRRIMSNESLSEAVSTIIRTPHNATRTREELTPLAFLSNPAIDVIAAQISDDYLEPGGPLASLFRGFTPTHLIEQHIDETFDTPENRYVKSVLVDLELLTDDLAQRLVSAKRPLSAEEVRVWNHQLQDWLSDSFWRGVGDLRQFPANSQVLKRREGYKDVLAADLSLQLGLQLPWQRGQSIADGLDGQVRPISELYEYWCFFILRSCLLNLCSTDLSSGSTLFVEGSQGLTLNLKRGKSSEARFKYLNSDGKDLDVHLYYNRVFNKSGKAKSEWDGSYSAQFKPDYSILVKVKEGDEVKRHWLHFDAKYRLDASNWEGVVRDLASEIEIEIDGVSASGMEGQLDKYKRSDLYKMHTYRDALLGTRGSYVLFPGNGDEASLFLRHPSQAYMCKPDFVFPGVGAFHLRPSSDESHRKNLQVFIGRVLKSISEADTVYTEEMGFFGT